MNLLFRLTLSFVIVTCFAGLTMAHRSDERLNLADFARDPEAFAGRTVEVEARVIAIDANGEKLELFDSPSRTRIAVELMQLPVTERTGLMSTDVRTVRVRGRAAIVKGRLTIHAESLQPVVESERGNDKRRLLAKGE